MVLNINDILNIDVKPARLAVLYSKLEDLNKLSDWSVSQFDKHEFVACHSVSEMLILRDILRNVDKDTTVIVHLFGDTSLVSSQDCLDDDCSIEKLEAEFLRQSEIHFSDYVDIISERGLRVLFLNTYKENTEKHFRTRSRLGDSMLGDIKLNTSEAFKFSGVYQGIVINGESHCIRTATPIIEIGSKLPVYELEIC